jgi:hypothetical protein
MNSKQITGQKLGSVQSTDMVQPNGPVGTTEAAARTPAARRPMDRRSFLRVAGLGVGTLAVAGAGGVTWRAVDGGVFATGTGPAYAAWDRASPSGQNAMGMVRAAVLAANAHNTQPWHFKVAKDRIDLFADTSRNIGAMDPLEREMHISLGCAIENLVLAGPANGKTPTVTLIPDPTDGTHIARVDLVPVHRSASALFRAIPIRHTNRAAYDVRRPVAQRQLDGLGSLVDAPDTELVWFTRADDKRAFGDLTIRATQAIIADPQQAADDFAWYRTDWQEIQTKKDGITIDASGQSPLIRTLAKILPVSRQQSNDGWLSGTRDTQIPTAAAFGALVVRDPIDPIQRLRVGRIWQRIHLSATANGLAMQPLCQIPERIDRERSAELPGDFTTAMSTMLPAGWHPIMTFRIGHPTGDALPSPRRPATDVVLT